MFKASLLAAALTAGLVSGVQPAAAQTAPTAPTTTQDATGRAIAEIVVYGNDPCPRSTDDSAVVCYRRPESERYRLAPNQRLSGNRQQRSSWANRAQQVNSLGATGINSCSAVGPGGFTGCLQQQIQEARRARREDQEADTPPQQ
ncbi:hypothetical protein HMF7854_03145 [Sphingomonas ginkgonis]|uniref:Uncharacterized protein n=1 Tax=Sphingomonas ginkgonis TaxID=2315330 RepID=A0A3R9X6G7_9SPHN|nr:hypothetical protein [Sphingomonas ginkgonis]RST29931.1 hypothetical protein HMF7854_03145 [Sphingomonas ginkgonis]